jgi:hypothetical protein
MGHDLQQDQHDHRSDDHNQEGVVFHASKISHERTVNLRFSIF